LEFSSTVIQEIGSALTETKVRLTQVIGGIYHEETRERVAEGINDILEQVVSLANTKNMGQYLFGGNNTKSAPYLVERTNGEISGVTYQGSLENREIEVASGIKSSAFYVGYDIFGSDDYDGSDYNLSIDDAVTVIDVGDVSDPSNVAVTNSAGQVLYVDATKINSTGVEPVSIPGTHDIFNTLASIRDMLKNEKELSDAQLKDLQDNSLIMLEEVNQLLVQAEVSVGSKIGFLDNLKDSLIKLKYDAEDEVTLLQEADIAQIAIDLSRREVLYQMSLSIAGKLMSVSLLDFIR